MALSARTRFEVLKRDRFSCAYCGRTPNDGVLLEVDHVLPRAAGGTDDLDNLITACVECNRGKAARMLEEGSIGATVGAIEGTKRSIEDVRQRLAQAREYQALVAEEEHARALLLDEFLLRWTLQFGGRKDDENHGYYCDYGFPNVGTLTYFSKELAPSEIFEAIDITAAKFTREYPNTYGRLPRVVQESCQRYVYAICHRKIRERKGAPEPGR